jgi:hypothetical protein
MGDVLVAISLLVLFPFLVGLLLIDRNERRERERIDAEIQQVAAYEQWARYDDLIDSCERGNRVRVEVRNLQEATQGLAYLLSAFFDSSAEFRLRQGNPALAEESAKIRDRVLRLADRIQLEEPIDCAGEIEKPNVERPGGAREPADS